MVESSERPILLESSSVHYMGKTVQRLMLILRTNGCSYAKATGGCSHCSLIQNSKANIDSADVMQQFDEAIQKHGESIEMLDLLTLGSFFDEQEIPEEAFTYILTSISKFPNIKTILLESRPEFITDKKLRKATEILKNQQLDIGIGIESTNVYMREQILKKGYTLADVENVLRKFATYDIGFLGYVLFKPVGLGEQEAIEDAIKTIYDIFALGTTYGLRTRIALQPFYIPRHSKAYHEYCQGRYKAPMFWSVIETLKATDHLGTIQIAFNDEGLSDGLVTSNCPKCDQKVIEALQHYNVTKDVTPLEALDCSCKSEWFERLKDFKNS